MQFQTLAIVIILCQAFYACQTVGAAEKQKEKWTEPNAWAREVEVNSFQEATLDNDFCTCNAADPADGFADNQAAIIIFKKFIRYLFNREKLEYDTHFSLYQRELLFTVLPAQLEKLEQLSDPRDLDSVLTEIFGNARTPDKYNRNNSTWSSIFALIWDILKDLVMLLRFSEMQFILFVVSFITIVWFIHRRHNVGIVVVIVSGVLVFGYFVTYLECNRELELKQMLDVIEKNEATKPTQPSWYTPITSWFSSSSDEVAKTERREKLKKATKLNLTFCRPDHVLILYANELFVKQLEFIIEKCVTTLTSLREKFSFPQFAIATLALVFMFTFIIKLTFKHILSPRNWTGYFQRTQRSAITDQSYESIAHGQDRLSGENLSALLNALKSPNILVTNSTLPIGSCVQEVPLESLEALKEKSDSSNNSNNSGSSHNNSNLSNTSVSKSTASESMESMEAVAAELEARTKADAEFVLISQVESKVTLEDHTKD